jgi:hypothetical protein
VFGTNMVSTKTMAREGFALNIVGAILITSLMLFLL